MVIVMSNFAKQCGGGGSPPRFLYQQRWFSRANVGLLCWPNVVGGFFWGGGGGVCLVFFVCSLHCRHVSQTCRAYILYWPIALALHWPRPNVRNLSSPQWQTMQGLCQPNTMSLRCVTVLVHVVTCTFVQCGRRPTLAQCVEPTYAK